MKKIFSVLILCALVLSMTACSGKSDPAPASSDAVSSTSSAVSSAPAATSSAPKEAPADASPEQQAVLDEYNKMIDRYNAVVDQINADENLLALEEVVTVTNQVSDTLNELGTQLESTEALSAEAVASLKDVIANANAFVDEMEAMLANYSGKTIVAIQAELTNDTGVDLHGFAISPTNDDSWGANLLEEPLMAGESGVTTMSITDDTLVWDFMAMDAEGNTLSFMGLDFSEVNVETGAKIMLTVTEGGEYVATVA